MRDFSVGFPPLKHDGNGFMLMFILASLLFMMPACTNENPGEPKAPKVVVRMKAPPVPQPKSDEEIKEAAVSAPQDPVVSAGRESPDTERAPAPSRDIEGAVSENRGNGSETHDSKIAAADAAVENDGHASSKPVDVQNQPKVDTQDGLYRVRAGDTLASISAREDIYGDKLKWPCLYRVNMDELEYLAVSGNLPEKALPEGTVLNYVTAEQAKTNLDRLGEKAWVVNVLSSKNPERIVPAAVRLMKGGFTVYIVRAEVKGDHWMRLRAGFFEDGTRARVAGEEIAQIATTGKLWVAKVQETELREFGGY